MRLLLHPMTMSCLKLPYQARVPVIRGLTRFLTMAEVALVQDGQDGEVIIDCVAIFLRRRQRRGKLSQEK